MMETVRMWDYAIDDNSPPYFVCELGICHQGKVEIARQIARAAKEAGANCIKTETFQRGHIVFDKTMTTSYDLPNGKHVTEPLLDHMEKYQLEYDEHAEIKRYSDELGLPFMSTAHDLEAIDFLADIGAAAVKISSADIIHQPLLRHAAKTDMVIFMDVGGAFQWEIEKAVKVARDAGAKGIVVNHHPGGHPCKAENYDLRIIPHLKYVLQIPIGTADHYGGYEMVYGATAVGVNVIEKPVSLDRMIELPEHSWSIGIADLPEVLDNMRKMYYALGVPERKNVKHSPNRVSLVAKEDLPEGTQISLDNVFFGRPTNGICIEHWDIVEGRALRVPKKKGEFIQWEDV